MHSFCYNLFVNNKTSQIDQMKTPIKKKYPDKYVFFIGFLAISFMLAFIIGGIYFGKSKSSKQTSETNLKEQVKITAEELPDNPDKWKKYSLKTLGLEIKLPEELSKNGGWKEQTTPSSEEGSIVCFSNEKSEGAACQGEILFAGGTSTNFIEGREITFTDLQGFSKENSKFFIKTTGGNRFELTNAKFRESNNSNGVEIIKILGENLTPEGSESPIGGTPGKGYLGAIINTKNSNYPGLSIQLKIDEGVSEYQFDQILESIKYIN